MIEAALFSVSLSKAKILKEQERKGASSLVAVKEKIHQSITVIVIFNNAFNIVGSMMVGVVAINIWGSTWIGLISAFVALLIIFFGEIIPKSIGESYAVSISLLFARPLVLATSVFSPFILIIDFLTRPFEKKKRIISEDEIKILSYLGHMEGSIEADEKEMIQKVFLLNDLTAKDIMTPRTVVEFLEAEETLGNSEEKIYSVPHSRLPIYDGNLDNIIGICHQRDLLIALSKDEKNRKIKEFAKKESLLFVPEDIKLDELIPLFQKQKTHLAVVKDGFNGTAGVVTFEDALEQIVGEIVDETDKVVDLRKKAKNLDKER